MQIDFFDVNPQIVNELKQMDQSSKEYKKILKKILVELGGLPFILSNLKESEEGNRIRRRYFKNLIVSGVLILLLFVWIFVTLGLTGGKEIEQFNGFEMNIFNGFIFVEILTTFLVFLFAFKSRKTIFQGLNYIINSYDLNNFDNTEKSLANYEFKKYKVNKKVITITAVVAFAFTLLSSLLNNGFFDEFSIQQKSFSVAGMTITLTDQFTEKENISFASTYISNKNVVLVTKDDFSTLTEAGVSTDISLNEYADLVIEYNELDSEVHEESDITYYVYNKEVNGKELTYFATTFKGNDAFWIVTFACETKDFTSSKLQFINWAKTVKLTNNSI